MVIHNIATWLASYTEDHTFQWVWSLICELTLCAKRVRESDRQKENNHQPQLLMHIKELTSYYSYSYMSVQLAIYKDHSILLLISHSYFLSGNSFFLTYYAQNFTRSFNIRPSLVYQLFPITTRINFRGPHQNQFVVKNHVHWQLLQKCYFEHYNDSEIHLEKLFYLI